MKFTMPRMCSLLALLAGCFQVAAAEPAPKAGTTLDLKFRAFDERAVDLAQLRGKVVLIEFWATWCGPCVRTMPAVKAAYEKLHPRGLEIIGVSFDKSRPSLGYFLKQHEIPWPQYFDGLGLDNKLGARFGVETTPTLWMVDKQGKLRDLNAGEKLGEKIDKLLAEP